MASEYLHSKAKRRLDVAGALALGAGLGIPALASLPFIAADGGPAIFRQKRHSNGAPFEMLKLRTMYEGAEKDEPMWTGHNDPRATRIGALLRKSSIDEVPQLLNVLKGELSLVGYRPPTDRVLERYAVHGGLFDEWHEMTQCTKAGITGLAQHYAKLTPRHDAECVEAVMRLDLHYAEHASLAMDLKILAGTAGCMWERSAERALTPGMRVV